MGHVYNLWGVVMGCGCHLWVLVVAICGGLWWAVFVVGGVW